MRKRVPFNMQFRGTAPSWVKEAAAAAETVAASGDDGVVLKRGGRMKRVRDRGPPLIKGGLDIALGDRGRGSYKGLKLTDSVSYSSMILRWCQRNSAVGFKRCRPSLSGRLTLDRP